MVKLIDVDIATGREQEAVLDKCECILVMEFKFFGEMIYFEDLDRLLKRCQGVEVVAILIIYLCTFSVLFCLFELRIVDHGDVLTQNSRAPILNLEVAPTNGGSSLRFEGIGAFTDWIPLRIRKANLPHVGCIVDCST